MRGALLAVALSAMLAWSSPAIASDDIFHDGVEMSIDLAPVTPCYLHPDGIRDEARCEGLPELAPLPRLEQGPMRILAYGQHRLRDGRPGRMLFGRVADSIGSIHRGTAEKALEDYAKGLSKTVSGLTTKTANGRIEIVGALGVARGTVRLFDASGNAQSTHEMLFLFTDGGPSYLLAIIGPADAEAELSTISDSVMKTVHLARPAKANVGKDMSEEIGRWTAFVVMGVIAIAGIAYSSARARRHAEMVRRQQMDATNAPPRPWYDRP